MDPRQTGSRQEPAPEREDAPFPTRFGRDRHRRRPRPQPADRVEGTSGESPVAPDGEPPFGDDGGL